MKRILLIIIMLVTAIAVCAPSKTEAAVSTRPNAQVYTEYVYLPDIVRSGTEWTYHKTADNLHPDGNEQQLVWLMNRARSDPTAEGIWLATTTEWDIAGGRTYFNVNLALLQSEFASYTARPPAAFDARLYEAARLHSMDLIARDAQDHTGQLQRVFDTGIQINAWRGNVFSYADSALNAHGAFNIDWGPSTDGSGMQPNRGHRKAIMSLDYSYTNVGFAMVPENDPSTNVGTLVTTENFCYVKNNVANQYNRFVVGTVWQDLNANDRYDPGEGLGGVTVTLEKGEYYAITANSGGYAIPVTAEGTYTVRFTGVASGEKSVTVGTDSVLVDLKVAAGLQPTTPETGLGTKHAWQQGLHNPWQQIRTNQSAAPNPPMWFVP